MSLLRQLARSVTPTCRARVRAYASKAPAAASTPTPAANTAASALEADAKSSCPANMVMPGLNWLKGQEPVMALPEDQYPDWLWTILEPRKFADEGPGSKTDKYRMRKEHRQSIRDQNFMKTQ